MPVSDPRARGRRARSLGRRGERIAARWLRRHGYRVHARNLRTPRGEVDILAEQRGTIVLVEVKTTRRADGAPAQAPLRHAHRRRLRAAARWLARQPGLRGAPVRHDVAVVTLRGWRATVVVHRDVLHA